jgi:cytochrome c1
MIANDRDNLRMWLADPQQIKLGCLMPAFGLSSREIDEIVAYLSTLN